MYLLKEISTIGSGQNAPQHDYEYILDGKSFIKASNLDDIINDDNESRACKITNEAIVNHKLKLYPKNTIIFAKSGLSCVKNRVYITKADAYIVNHLCTVSNINCKYSPKWLAYFIKSFNVTKLIHDLSYPSISLKDIGNIQVPIVSLDKQQSIVKELDNIRILLKNKEKQLLSFDELIKSRFIEQFGKYDKVELHTISKITMGQSPDSSSYNDEGNGVPFFQGKGDYGEKYTVVRHYTTSPKKIAKQDSVLMSVRAPVGPVNIANTDCCIGRGLCSIDAIEGLTNNEFIYNALNAMQDEISGKGNGSTFSAINKDDVYKLFIPNAPINEQNEFSDFVKLIDKSKFVNYSKYFL